jgi:hypothetical protein
VKFLLPGLKAETGIQLLGGEKLLLFGKMKNRRDGLPVSKSFPKVRGGGYGRGSIE